MTDTQLFITFLVKSATDFEVMNDMGEEISANESCIVLKSGVKESVCDTTVFYFSNEKFKHFINEIN